MSMEPTKKLDRRMMSVWRIREVIALVCTAVVTAATAWFTWQYTMIPAICLCAVAAVQVICLCVLPQIRYARWRYEVTSTDVVVRSGLIIVKTSVIPMVRVQHVQSEQGPIMGRFGLASVTITTAGSSFSIPGLEAGEAEKLRGQVAVLARIAQEDV